MKSQFPRATPAVTETIPNILLADDATSADQIALAVREILGLKVVTTDASSLSRGTALPDKSDIRVINTMTRALSDAEARVQSQHLATQIFSGETSLPLLQIDSRLRGIGNAVSGFWESLDFDLLLFVPAEPELGRLVQNGIYCHVEDGRLTPFHQSSLAASAGRSFADSNLRVFIAGELKAAMEQVFSIPEDLVSKGPDAIVNFIRGIKRQGKFVVIPDIAGPEHFEAVNSAKKELGRLRILVAGSRTFLRSFFASFSAGNTGTHRAPLLSESIDRRKRGAPLALICSLEPATSAQLEYAQRAAGPNLVTVGFDSSVVLVAEQDIQREAGRVQNLVLQALKTMRPVLLHTSRTQISACALVQQRHLDVISKVVASEHIHRHLTALFVSGGQTAETVRRALGISAIEIKDAFQENIPWGMAVEGPFKTIPLVTKGGRMGKETVLFEFFEQGHPLPRANVVPVVTPLTSDKQIDEEGIEKLVAHLIRLGTTDVFAVGNAGEFRFLKNQQRLAALEIFARKGQGKLRVFAGVTGDTADETRRNYETARKLGVHAAVVMPLYFLKSSEEIVPFIESLSPIEPKLPLILYNNPERTNKMNISYEAIEAVQSPVVAIKDSSGDLDRLDRYARSMPVYEGQQRQFLEGYLHGARGSIGIIGHVSSLPNEFYAPETTPAGREEIARQINDLSKAVKQGGAEVAAYKYVLSLMGVIGDTVASNEPARDLTEAQRRMIRTSNADLISKMRVQSAG